MFEIGNSLRETRLRQQLQFSVLEERTKIEIPTEELQQETFRSIDTIVAMLARLLTQTASISSFMRSLIEAMWRSVMETRFVQTAYAGGKLRKASSAPCRR